MKFAYNEATGKVRLNRGSFTGFEKEGNCTKSQRKWGMDNDKYKVVDGVLTPLTVDDANSVETARLQNINVINAKAARQDAIDSDITVNGVVWKVDSASLQDIKDAVSYADRNNISPETEQAWLLADDSARMVTRAELEEVLNAYAVRKQSVFLSYATWLESGALSPFTI